MQNTKEISNLKIFNSAAITKNAAIESNPIDLASLAADGTFSLHITEFASAGAATVTVTYKCSNEDSPDGLITPTEATDIGTTLAKTTHFISFTPPPCKWLQIIVTEDDVAAVTAFSAYLFIQ